MEVLLGTPSFSLSCVALPPPQACLAYQLKDLQEMDKARVRSGKVPLYMVTQYSYGTRAMASLSEFQCDIFF